MMFLHLLMKLEILHIKFTMISGGFWQYFLNIQIEYRVYFVNEITMIHSQFWHKRHLLSYGMFSSKILRVPHSFIDGDKSETYDGRPRRVERSVDTDRISGRRNTRDGVPPRVLPTKEKERARRKVRPFFPPLFSRITDLLFSFPKRSLEWTRVPYNRSRHSIPVTMDVLCNSLA